MHATLIIPFQYLNMFLVPKIHRVSMYYFKSSSPADHLGLLRVGTSFLLLVFPRGGTSFSVTLQAFSLGWQFGGQELDMCSLATSPPLLRD